MRILKQVYSMYVFHQQQAIHTSQTIVPLPGFMIKGILYISFFTFFFVGMIAAGMLLGTDPSGSMLYWVSANSVNATLTLIIAFLLAGKYINSSTEEAYFSTLPIDPSIKPLGSISRYFYLILMIFGGALGYFYFSNWLFTNTFVKDEFEIDWLAVSYWLILYQFVIFVILIIVVAFLLGKIIEREKEQENYRKKFSNQYLLVTGAKVPVTNAEKYGVGIMLIFVFLSLLPTEFIGLSLPKWALYSLLITPGGLVAAFYLPAWQQLWIIPLFSTALFFYAVNFAFKGNKVSLEEKVEPQMLTFLPKMNDFRYYWLYTVPIFITVVAPSIFIESIVSQLLLVLLFGNLQRWISKIFTDNIHTDYMETLPLNWRKIYFFGSSQLLLLHLSASVLVLFFAGVSLSMLVHFLVQTAAIFVLGMFNIHLHRFRFQIIPKKLSVLKLLIVLGLIIVLNFHAINYL